ncbi:MAG: TetR family transcriptional regulator [Pseudomonadales bacterium]|nr:TetR family transcriptional regulator [Pseudomonadales bacterium]
MARPTQKTSTPIAISVKQRNDPRGNRRRRAIYKSLHDCIISKGYVKTTLADIAEAAGMSPSHLLYYFSGKEDILEQYFALVSERFLERISEFSQHPVQDQVKLLADFWFKGETSTKTEIGFMLECFGAAVHDEVLKVTKAEWDLRCKSYLTHIFESAPNSIVQNPKDGAEIAYAMMIGLRSAVYFDPDVDLDDAHRLFQATVNGMCGFSS